MKNFKKQLNLYDFKFILKSTIWVLIFYLGTGSLYGQDPSRFANQVAVIVDRQVDRDNPLIVFTGSSSVRMWSDLEDRFPQHDLVNTGFGGSHFSDLIHYAEELILRFNPVQVFIYEGDNDLAAGKSAAEITRDARKIVEIIHMSNKDCEVVLISPKPSLARWHLKEKYQTLNKALQKFADGEPAVQFADVWTPMLAPDGNVKSDLFIEDGLHMNQKGYDIWYAVIKPYLR